MPLPPGSGHGAYVDAWQRVVIPALERFGPEFVIVSSGFDGSAMDRLGRNMATRETFRVLACATAPPMQARGVKVVRALSPCATVVSIAALPIVCGASSAP